MQGSSYLEKLEEQVRKRPSSRLFLSLAEELGRRGREEESLSILREGVQRNPGFGPGRVALGKRYLSAALLPEARGEFLEALRVSPRSLPARRGLAEAYHRLNRGKEAAEEYRRVLELDPYDAEAAAFLDALATASAEEEAQETEEEGVREAELSGPSPVEEATGGGESAPPLQSGAGEAPGGEALREADQAVAEGHYGRAMERYRSLLALRPDDRLVLQRREELRALLKLDGGDRERAVERLHRLSGAIHDHFARYPLLGRRERAVQRLSHLSDAVHDRFVLYLAAGRKDAVVSRLSVFLDTIKGRFPLQDRR